MKKLFAVLLILLMAVSASAQKPFVADADGLLTKTEAKELEASFAEYYDTYGFTLAVHTVESLGDKTPAAAAAAAYKKAGYTNDGALFLICEKEGQWYLYTSGLCALVISDEDLAQLGADILDDLQSDNYADAIRTFAETCAEPVCKELSNQEEAASKTQKENGRFVIFGMIGGLVVGFMLSILLTVIIALGAAVLFPIREEEREAQA